MVDGHSEGFAPPETGTPLAPPGNLQRIYRTGPGCAAFHPNGAQLANDRWCPVPQSV